MEDGKGLVLVLVLQLLLPRNAYIDIDGIDISLVWYPSSVASGNYSFLETEPTVYGNW